MFVMLQGLLLLLPYSLQFPRFAASPHRLHTRCNRHSPHRSPFVTMHLRSQRIVLRPQKLSRPILLSTASSSSSSSSRRSQKLIVASNHNHIATNKNFNNTERKQKRYRSPDFAIDSDVFLRQKEIGKKIHGNESIPSIMDSKRMKEDETFVVGRRMTRAMNGEETRKLMLLKAMDAPSSIIKYQNREKGKDFVMSKDVNKHRKVKFQTMENSWRRTLPQRTETTGIYVSNCRATRLQVKKQEEDFLQRGHVGSSQEEIVHHHHEKENYSIHPLLSSSLSSRDVTARSKQAVIMADEKSPIEDRKASTDPKGRTSAGKPKCKTEWSLVLRNKRRNDVDQASYKPKEAKKTCLSRSNLCLEDNEVSRMNRGPSNTNLLEEAINIQDLHHFQESKIKMGEDNFQRHAPTRMLRNSKIHAKNSSGELKEDRSHILQNKKELQEGDVQKNEGGSVLVASRSSKRKKVTENDLYSKNNHGANGIIPLMNPVGTEKCATEGMEEIRYGLRSNEEIGRAKVVGNKMDVISTREEVAQDCLLESDMENIKFDPSSKWCLIRTDPSETGGRQMRPRPLSLDQPLLVLIEGQDQDYHELDGGSFYQTVQQAEAKFSPSNKLKLGRKLSKVSTPGWGEVSQTISTPSFRCVMESDGVLPKLMPLYTLPKSYIKAIPEVQSGEPEYDVDEEDEEWLKRYNQTVPPTSTLSVDQYEKIVDLLETKVDKSIDVFSDIQDGNEKDQAKYVECCICNGCENSASNLILQCVVCRIHVHQLCYGVQDFEIGQKKQKWRCRKCEAVAAKEEDGEISCALCRKQGGALKPATEPNKWAHVACALYTNETYFVDTDAMEPIKGLDAADARAKRQRRECFLCGKREGCVEKCSVPGCKASFHVSCGVAQGASFKLLHSNQQVTSVLIYCPTHASKTSDVQPVSLEKMFQGREPKHRKVQKRSVRKDEIHSIPDKEATQREDANGKDRKLLPCVNSNSDDFNGVEGGSSHFVEGIYLHWLSKRADFGGPLLHHLQQEHAKKQFSIFNPVEDVTSEESFRSEENFKHMEGTSDVIPRVWEQLKTSRLISNLVVEREKLKLGLHLVDLDIFNANLDALKARSDTVRLCSTCWQPHLSLICTVCFKNTCFYCFKKVNQCHSWLSSLKLPKYVCAECGKQDFQITQRHSTCRYSELEDCENKNGLSWPTRSSSLIEADCNNSNLCPTKKKLCMLLPRTESVNQDKSVTKAFWEQNHLKKTLLVTDILKCITETS